MFKNKELLGVSLFFSILSTSCNDDQASPARTIVPVKSENSTELSIKDKTCNSEIELRVKKLFAEQLGIKEEIPLSANFCDLGVDSLDTVELVMALEEEFELEIPDDEAEKITTVGETVNYVCANMK